MDDDLEHTTIPTASTAHSPSSDNSSESNETVDVDESSPPVLDVSDELERTLDNPDLSDSLGNENLN